MRRSSLRIARDSGVTSVTEEGVVVAGVATEYSSVDAHAELPVTMEEEDSFGFGPSGRRDETSSVVTPAPSQPTQHLSPTQAPLDSVEIGGAENGSVTTPQKVPLMRLSGGLSSPGAVIHVDAGEP